MGNYDFELDLESVNTMSVINRWITHGSTVLEFGPANGRLTRYLKHEKNCRITIVELDAEAGNEAALSAVKGFVGPEDGDIERYHWLSTEERFDYIIFADVLEHLRNPRQVLAECAKVLKPEGSILLSVPNLGHNSVMISLLQDRFFYDKTGLLDQTHVHFFTYQSLLQTIRDSGFHVNETVPVYSRVGDNEITATYEEVPFDVEFFLRNRPTGSVYQFVCKISKTDSGKDYLPFDIPFEQEKHHYIECRCYYRTNKATPFCDAMSIARTESLDGVHRESFEIPEKMRQIRFDPVFGPSVILLEKAVVTLADGTIRNCAVHTSTASTNTGNLFVFDKYPSSMIFHLQRQDIRQFSIQYRVLRYGEKERQYVQDCMSGHSTRRGIAHSKENKSLSTLQENESKPQSKALDLVYVTYNSSRWIDNCFASVVKSDYDLKKINVYVVDNNSSDDTLEKLNHAKQSYGDQLGAFEIIPSKENLGFGKGNNLGFSVGTSDIVCFFNIDTELCENTLKELQKDIDNSDETVGLWELRQFPYEHPKFYDPLTQETSWSSGAAFSIRRELFKMLHGFDDGIFMYAEDVDLSWRLRSYGYSLKYCPNSVIYHYSYESAGQIKPNQYLNCVINNLLLRYRFGTLWSIIKGHLMVLRQLTKPSVFPHSRSLLLQKYLRHFGQIPHFLNPFKRGNNPKFKATFLGFDYAPIRDGAFYENVFPTTQPLVSIIVRTCGRPSVLRETLISLRHQTYPNLEIVVVEDGAAVSEKMIREEFSDLNIRYEATGEKVGRSKAGNRAMTIASGKYLNFLDDDDLFYADHVEVLVKALEQENCRAAYSFAFETPITVHSKEPYSYTIHGYLGVHKQTYNPIILCHHNYIPIQAIMFEKTLFEEYGGMDESVDALEDWDLWVRYSLYTDFTCVNKTTSIYRVPFKRSLDAQRQKALDEALIVVREKHKGYMNCINASVYDISVMVQQVMENRKRRIWRRR